MQALDRERTARLHGLLYPMHLDAVLLGRLVLQELRRACTSGQLRHLRIEPPPARLGSSESAELQLVRPEPASRSDRAGAACCTWPWQACCLLST